MPILVRWLRCLCSLVLVWFLRSWAYPSLGPMCVAGRLPTARCRWGGSPSLGLFTACCGTLPSGTPVPCCLCSPAMPPLTYLNLRYPLSWVLSTHLLCVDQRPMACAPHPSGTIPPTLCSLLSAPGIACFDDYLIRRLVPFRLPLGLLRVRCYARRFAPLALFLGSLRRSGLPRVTPRLRALPLRLATPTVLAGLLHHAVPHPL